MARSRIIYPEFLINDPELSSLEIGARYLHVLLLMNMDRNGVFPAATRVILNHCFVHDPKIKAAQITKWVNALCQRGVVRKFSHRGIEYLIDPRFVKQEYSIHAREKKDYDIPPGMLLGLVQEMSEERSGSKLGVFTSTSTFISSGKSDKKNQASREVADTALIPHTSNDADATDAEILKLKAEVDARFAPQLQDIRDSQNSNWAGPVQDGNQ